MSDTRILFVDDDRDILAMVEQYLTIKGYDVTTVDNGIEAVGIVKEKQIDIVFTDYKMPESCGMSVLPPSYAGAAAAASPGPPPRPSLPCVAAPRLPPSVCSETGRRPGLAS